jgi:hypothetical protein
MDATFRVFILIYVVVLNFVKRLLIIQLLINLISQSYNHLGEIFHK